MYICYKSLCSYRIKKTRRKPKNNKGFELVLFLQISKKRENNKRRRNPPLIETNRKENKMPKKASGNFDRSKYINNYIKEKYDRINLTVPVGTKEAIKSQASIEGKSINEYIKGLISADLEKKSGIA